jgi:tetratricopeptide (TPR) repeat protein
LINSCGFSTGIYQDVIKAESLLKNNKYLEASKIYNKILDKSPPLDLEIRILFQLGEINSSYLNKFDESIKYFLDVVEKSSDPIWHIKSYEKLASISFDGKRYDLSKKFYEKLSKIKPELKNKNFYLLKVAESNLNLKDFNLSKEQFIECTLKNIDYEKDCYYYLGLIHYYENSFEEANNYWFKYLKLEKNKEKIVNIKFLIANSYESLEKYKNAYDIYYSILGEFPNSEIIKKRLKSVYDRRVARKR